MDPFNKHGLILIDPRIDSYHVSIKVWEEITYPFPKFNAAQLKIANV